MTKITSEDLVAMMELFERSDWKVLHLETDENEVYFSKDPARRRGSVGIDSVRERPAATAQPVQAAPIEAQAPVQPASTQADTAVDESEHIIRALSLGTFYLSPKPGAAPYVRVGDKVSSDSEVCLIEVMKLFTTVQAGVSGVISKVYVNDGELVEYDQPLFAIEIDG